MKSPGYFLTAMILLLSISCGKDNNPDQINNKKRYKDAVFSNVSSFIDVTYGTNASIGGANTTLKLDFYYPDGDTAISRPLLILLPGGSFGPMTDKRAYLIPEAEAITKYGYVVAVINYRIYDGGSYPISRQDLKHTILHGMQDAKAAIRFFREDAATSNIYRINPNKIFIGGHSAGAMVALHTIYLDNIAEADTEFQNIIQSNGGLEGNSGHAGYSSAASGVINLAGALLDKNYITANSKPLKNLYGSDDTIIPIEDGFFINEPSIASIYVRGGNSLNTHAKSLGVTSSNYVIPGGDHSSPALATCSGCLDALAGFMFNLL